MHETSSSPAVLDDPPPPAVHRRALRRAVRAVAALHALPDAVAQAHGHWAERYARYCAGQPFTSPRAHAFLRTVRTDPDLDASLRAQAEAAVAFVHAHVLRHPLRDRPDPLLDHLSTDEQDALLTQLDPAHRLLACLVWDAGLHLEEAVALRVGDLDLEAGTVTVRTHDGLPGDTLPLPPRLRPALRRQRAAVRRLHARDRRDGVGAFLPRLLRRAGAEATAWRWQFLFPAPAPARDAATGTRHRSALAPTAILRALVRLKGDRLAWPDRPTAPPSPTGTPYVHILSTSSSMASTG
jgi:integrase